MDAWTVLGGVIGAAGGFLAYAGFARVFDRAVVRRCRRALNRALAHHRVQLRREVT